jgi:hypothetical protein
MSWTLDRRVATNPVVRGSLPRRGVGTIVVVGHCWLASVPGVGVPARMR